MNKRIIFALLFIIVAILALNVVEEPSGLQLPSIFGLFVWASLFGVGGFIARKGFVIPSVVFYILLYAATIYILYEIGRVADSSISIVDLAVQNLGGQFFPLLAAVLGALVGQRLYQHFARGSTSAN